MPSKITPPNSSPLPPEQPTPQLTRQIRGWLLKDSYFEVACQACGLPAAAGVSWRERGCQEFIRRSRGEAPRPEETPYQDFFLAVEKAEARVEAEDIRDIRKGSPNWHSKAWIRERRSFERWGKKETVEHTGKNGKPIESIVRVVDH